jgi:hypothetical protein
VRNAEAVARLLAPALVSDVAVLIQIRDGKDSRDMESAIQEARPVIHLAIRTEAPSGGGKAWALNFYIWPLRQKRLYI